MPCQSRKSNGIRDFQNHSVVFRPVHAVSAAVPLHRRHDHLLRHQIACQATDAKESLITNHSAFSIQHSAFSIQHSAFMKHPFLILLIIIQVIVIFCMNRAQNAWFKANNDRNHKLFDAIIQLIDDGHGREVGKILSDYHRKSIESGKPLHQYLQDALAELHEKPVEPTKNPESEEVPKAEGGDQP